MATWGEQTSPVVKFEASPAESFISTPGEMYPSLFRDSTPSSTLNPLDILTPHSNPEGKDGDATAQLALTGLSAAGDDDSATPAANGEKKPVKKRKSWGQVLPEPKTNLPPRKRAKTEDEKEQRRVERVLRNRRAAQSSRERKRLEVEALEQRNRDLEVRLLKVEKMNLLLVEELNKFRRTSGVVARSSSPLGSLQSNQLTLSQELFSSQDGPRFLDANASSLMDLSMPESDDSTVDPASLSPQLAPVPDETAEASSTGTPSDLTQRPAAMLCDLQCHQSEDLPRSWTPSRNDPWTPQLRTILMATSLIVSACRRPLTQIAMSLKAGFSLPPTPSIMKTIIWLVTRPTSSRSRSTSRSSSTTTSRALPRQTPRRGPASHSQRNPNSTSSRPTLRIRTLQKILTCSPTLARPLQDATMEALRLVSKGSDDLVGRGAAGTTGTRDADRTQPTAESLLTLLWALRVHERRQLQTTVRPDQDHHTPTQKFVLRVSSDKRKRGGVLESGGYGEKRPRLA